MSDLSRVVAENWRTQAVAEILGRIDSWLMLELIGNRDSHIWDDLRQQGPQMRVSVELKPSCDKDTLLAGVRDCFRNMKLMWPEYIKLHGPSQD